MFDFRRIWTLLISSFSRTLFLIGRKAIIRLLFHHIIPTDILLEIVLHFQHSLIGRWWSCMRGPRYLTPVFILWTYRLLLYLLQIELHIRLEMRMPRHYRNPRFPNRFVTNSIHKVFACCIHDTHSDLVVVFARWLLPLLHGLFIIFAAPMPIKVQWRLGYWSSLIEV